MTPRETHTPRRTIRVENALWLEAARIAAEQGETVSEILRKALQRYVRKNGIK